MIIPESTFTTMKFKIIFLFIVTLSCKKNHENRSENINKNPITISDFISTTAPKDFSLEIEGEIEKINVKQYVKRKYVKDSISITDSIFEFKLEQNELDSIYSLYSHLNLRKLPKVYSNYTCPSYSIPSSVFRIKIVENGKQNEFLFSPYATCKKEDWMGDSIDIISDLRKLHQFFDYSIQIIKNNDNYRKLSPTNIVVM